MKETDVRQRMESFMKMPRAAAIIVAGLLGLACSNSSLKRSAGDAGAENIGAAVPSGTPPFNSHMCYPVCV